MKMAKAKQLNSIQADSISADAATCKRIGISH
jgi:hypothetical protein